VKAVLVHHGVHVPRSHDLAYLIGMLPEAVSLPLALIELPTLTKYAVQHRYPGEVSTVTAKQRRDAIGIAHDAVTWASRVVRHT
jgi:HEPN domain-containing protein